MRDIKFQAFNYVPSQKKLERKGSASVKRERGVTIDLTGEEPRKRARRLPPIDLTDC